MKRGISGQNGAPVRYVWGRDTSTRRPWWRLRPEGSPDWYALNSIATVYTRGREVHGSYCWHSTGNRTENYIICKSVPQAKRWIEAELAKFSEPPEVRG